MRQIPGRFSVRTRSTRRTRGVEAIALFERVRSRKSRVDPGWQRALEIREKRSPSAKRPRDRECGARQVRLNRPSEEIPEAGTRHSLRFPLPRELREVPPSQEIGEVHLRYLKELIPSNALQRNP